MQKKIEIHLPHFEIPQPSLRDCRLSLPQLVCVMGPFLFLTQKKKKDLGRGMLQHYATNSYYVKRGYRTMVLL